MKRSLLHNDELREQGKETARWQVVDPTPRDGWIKVFDRETHQEAYKALSEISDGIADDRLVLVRHRAPRVSAAAQDDPELDKELQAAQACLRKVEQTQKKYGVSFRKACEIAEEEHNPEADSADPFPSRATLYRYAEARRNGLPLLRGDKNKGNRKQRYDQQIVDLICNAAKALFLKQGSRWTLVDLAEYVNDRARESGWLASGKPISRRFVAKTILLNLSADPEIDRMDPKDVAAAKSIAKNRIIVALPFDRVEQDALHLPFVVMTRHGATSNVYLVHAIDCCTGLPVGWHMVIGAATESDGLRCVESILFSKRTRLAKLGLAYDLDVFGAPHQLIFDNGPETKGERMDRLTRLDIDPMHCKSRHAHGKPFIERLNRSLKDALQTLPGCTRVDGKDGQRDPVALGDKLMSEEELEQWIVRWYFEDWANTELERHVRSDFRDITKLGSTPAMRWKSLTQEHLFAMPLPPPRSEWLMTLYEHEVRTLSRKTGISCRGFNYKGDNLPYLLNRYGEVPLGVLVNPDDYRQIYIDDGPDRPLVALTEEFVDETTPAYSFAHVKELLKDTIPMSNESPVKTAFRRDVHTHAIASTGTPASKKQSKAEKNRATANRVKESMAIRRAAENPIPPRSDIPRASDLGFEQPSFDNVPPLAVLNRVDGEKQK
ncbi:DDE-type integrase/transposase/recombinase [Paraburkholderia aspalathi]|uniref:Putative transposase n=1 Tax=Paraburkholderia aspalathi TaxID=1324617 RepID=A0A1I7CDX5_9BURK|nr:DDE-type integrase/transposase/recombinase [Paraburkholderia aspalathi]SFT97647.1 putative transposase [Paraburkholderia aspalathi]